VSDTAARKIGPLKLDFWRWDHRRPTDKMFPLELGDTTSRSIRARPRATDTTRRRPIVCLRRSKTRKDKLSLRRCSRIAYYPGSLLFDSHIERIRVRLHNREVARVLMQWVENVIGCLRHNRARHF
jgi:hypothetical protein